MESVIVDMALVGVALISYSMASALGLMQLGTVLVLPASLGSLCSIESIDDAWIGAMACTFAIVVTMDPGAWIGSVLPEGEVGTLGALFVAATLGGRYVLVFWTTVGLVVVAAATPRT